MNWEPTAFKMDPIRDQVATSSWQKLILPGIGLMVLLMACSQEVEMSYFSKIGSQGIHFTNGQLIDLHFADSSQTVIVLFPILPETEFIAPSRLDILEYIEAEVFKNMYVPEYFEPGPALREKITSKVAHLITYSPGLEMALNDQIIQQTDKSPFLLLTTPSGRDRFIQKWETPDLDADEKTIHVYIYKPNQGVQIMKFPLDRDLWGKSIIFGTIAEQH